MKKICKTIVILLLVVGFSEAISAFEFEPEETFDNDALFKWKLFWAIGFIDLGFTDDTIDGFVFFGYNAGKILLFRRVNIEIEGMPFVISQGLFYAICLYKTS